MGMFVSCVVVVPVFTFTPTHFFMLPTLSIGDVFVFSFLVIFEIVKAYYIHCSSPVVCVTLNFMSGLMFSSYQNFINP